MGNDKSAMHDPRENLDPYFRIGSDTTAKSDSINNFERD
jgi:hypothetical protein